MAIDIAVTDGCTGIPNKVFGVDIGVCCEEHDTVKPCSVINFYRCLKWKLRKVRVLSYKIYNWSFRGIRIGKVLAFVITAGGTIGCWWKYPKFMMSKLKK